MGQAQMSWNINALPVSIGGISAEFGTAPSTVVTAIVAYSLGVAGFTMLGARLGQQVRSAAHVPVDDRGVPRRDGDHDDRAPARRS